MTSMPRKSGQSRKWIIPGVVVLLLGAMALDTKVVQVGSSEDSRQQAFNPDSYGQAEFPKIAEGVAKKAVDALTLGPAVLADKDAAAKQYGTPSTTGAILLVKFTAVVGEGKSGVYALTVDGLPADIKLRIQTGPAINDTVLRDATGEIAFGEFKNQIEYQDAGSGINRAMKAAILDTIDTANLTGKTIEVIGGFRLINPKNWLITPSAVTVK